jgi:glycosyltransferase involved in cell wall biosynthesis
MLFSVDAHAVGCHLTGNEVYIRSLLNEFAELDPEASFLNYVSRAQAEQYLPNRFLKRRVSANPFVRLGLDLPLALRRDRPDLIHVQYTAPLACPVPVVVSVHDVSYLQFPQYFTAFRSRQLKITVARTVRQAARILTPSEFSRRSIIEAYRVPEDKVVTIPNAVSPSFRPVLREAASERVARKYRIRVPYLLTVGDLQPRKNHVGLLRAFSELLDGHPTLPHQLVMVGKDTWFAPEIRKEVRRLHLEDRVHFTGWVEDEDLVHLYGGCDLFVFPSFYEGFGLPILEAMACGRAVACSNTSSMPEVADAAAILFDPGSPKAIARALKDLLLNPDLRLRMERLGLLRASTYSWKRSADATLDVYYEVSGARRKKVAPAAAAGVSVVR